MQRRVALDRVKRAKIRAPLASIAIPKADHRPALEPTWSVGRSTDRPSARPPARPSVSLSACLAGPSSTTSTIGFTCRLPSFCCFRRNDCVVPAATAVTWDFKLMGEGYNARLRCRTSRTMRLTLLCGY